MRRAAGFLDAFIDAELARSDCARRLCPDGVQPGGDEVLFTGLRRATAPRAILAFSGALVAPERLAAELANRAPVLLVHGEADDVVPVIGRAMPSGVAAAGVPVSGVSCRVWGTASTTRASSMGALALQRAFVRACTGVTELHDNARSAGARLAACSRALR